jgi:hypothetical protein
MAFVKQQDSFFLIALLSLTPKTNLFVAPDGRWLGGYVPSYFRGYPFQREAGPKAAVPENHGKLLGIVRNGVGHMVYYTKSTIGANVTPEEGGRFFQTAAQFLDNEKPDIVISYGSSAYTKELQTMARKKCRQFVFYVANAGFTDPDMFDASDTGPCPKIPMCSPGWTPSSASWTMMPHMPPPLFRLRVGT